LKKRFWGLSIDRNERKNGKTYGQTYVFGFQCVNKNIEGIWLFRFCISNLVYSQIWLNLPWRSPLPLQTKVPGKTLLGINSTNVHTCTIYNSTINKVHSHLVLGILGLIPLTPC